MPGLLQVLLLSSKCGEVKQEGKCPALSREVAGLSVEMAPSSLAKTYRKSQRTACARAPRLELVAQADDLGRERAGENMIGRVAGPEATGHHLTLSPRNPGPAPQCLAHGRCASRACQVTERWRQVTPAGP